MEQDLRNRGVGSEVIGEAFASLERDGADGDEAEEALARRLLEKKHFLPEEAGREETRKMAAFLYRKGIGGGTIRRILGDAGGQP